MKMKYGQISITNCDVTRNHTNCDVTKHHTLSSKKKEGKIKVKKLYFTPTNEP